jgi:hypothetical protein
MRGADEFTREDIEDLFASLGARLQLGGNTTISARPDEESMLPILTWDCRSEVVQRSASGPSC